MPLRLLQILFLTGVAALARAAEPDATQEFTIARAFIPSAQNRHGEVRLVRRGGEHAVQTLLCSAQLRRGIKAIRNKEQAAWPPDRPGHADSCHYLEGLKSAEERALQSPPDERGRFRLLVECVSDGAAARVKLGLPKVEEAPDGFHVRSVEPIGEVDVSPEYAARAMDLMMESAFSGEDEP